MKYTFCEKFMWFALSGPSFRYLEQQGKAVDKKKAKEIFRQMAARTPDIGSLTENPLRISLSGGDCCDFHICKKGSKWDITQPTR